VSPEKTYYLAGPMSGLPQYNFPEFYRVAKELRLCGFKIISPAELDDEETAAAALAAKTSVAGETSVAGKSWADFLQRDVKIIADQCQGIVFLPGWRGSRGARLEAFVGLLSKAPFEFWELTEFNSLRQISPLRVLDRIYGSLTDGF